MKIICDVCGKSFEPAYKPARGAYKKQCSDECRKLLARKRSRDGMRKKRHADIKPNTDARIRLNNILANLERIRSQKTLQR